MKRSPSLNETDREQLQLMLGYARQAMRWVEEAGATWIADEKTLAAVALVVGQLGERARRVSDELAQQTDLPWPRIRGMRNVLYHDYLHLNAEILRGTVKDDLPDLARKLAAILGAE